MHRLLLLDLPHELVRCVLELSLHSKGASVRVRTVCHAFRDHAHAIMCSRAREYRLRSNVWFVTPTRTDIFVNAGNGETLSTIIERCRLPVHARYFLQCGTSIRVLKSLVLIEYTRPIEAGCQFVLNVVRVQKRSTR